MRRAPEKQWRFVRNIDADRQEVHDLDNEQYGPNECQLTELFTSGRARYVKIGADYHSLQDWLDDNLHYDGCKHCLPQFHRN